MPLHPVILAGGSGTRMWPLSREAHPKQFLRLMGKHSLFQDTVRRLDGTRDVTDPLIICNEEHRFLVAELLRQLDKDALAIALEPVGRNTAPALTLAALMLLDKDADFANDDPVMLVLPADHVVRDAARFRRLVEFGATEAARNGIITFGIQPDSPKTGYGYIRKGEQQPLQSGVSAFQVAEFIEKPGEQVAREMLNSEAYLWNSGMFMMRASVWMQELRRHRPDIADACIAAHAVLRQDGDFYRPDAAQFAACPSESIDYAVMEHMGKRDSDEDTTGCLVLPMDIGWTDLGAAVSEALSALARLAEIRLI
ncbi:MAG: sugar phosphate nucleotidyltransferase, partial [Chloroflexi bacterium]|nr:sugar phosphate nucleotidyltransferase [Chloroflexota bacterium]